MTRLIGAIREHHKVWPECFEPGFRQALIPLQPGLHLSASDAHRINEDTCSLAF